MGKKVIIVGGGIAGLAAGVYARQSGLDAVIYEMHSIPGGNSTSWKRGGYLFEGGMHWLTGSKDGLPLNKLWKEIGALKENNPIRNRDPFLTYVGGGREIHLYRDLEKLQAHLLDVAPEDEKAIGELVQDIKKLGRLAVSMGGMDVRGVKLAKKEKPPLSMITGFLAAMGRMKKLSAMTAGEYADRFTNKGLNTLMHSIVGDDSMAANAIAFTLGTLAYGDGGYPEGGSLRMAKNIADSFKALGGTICYNTKIDQISVKNGRANGVMVGGTLHPADYVIVASDTRMAIDTLFEKPLGDDWANEMRRDILPMSCTFISLGVKADLTHMPEHVVYPLKKPFDFCGKQTDIGFNNYAGFKGYAPAGGSAVTCFVGGDTYDFWKAAKADGTYEEKKKALALTVIDRLAECVPETLGKVEVWDVATPLTYERYCGTYRGSWMSVTTPAHKRQFFPAKSEEVGRVYFAGQRVMLPGGLPGALITGRQAVQHICVEESLVFQGGM